MEIHKLPIWLQDICAAIREEIAKKARQFAAKSTDLSTAEALTQARLNPSNNVRGVLFGEVIQGPLLRKNKRLKLLFTDVMSSLALNLEKDFMPRNNTLYMNSDAGMAWHTNEDVLGKRLYIIYNEKPGSVFRYAVGDSTDIIDVVEPAGWHIKIFEITKDPLLWHSIKAAGKRLSIGYRFDGEINLDVTSA